VVIASFASKLAPGPVAAGAFGNTCSRCGGEVKPGLKFCPQCGNKLKNIADFFFRILDGSVFIDEISGSILFDELKRRYL
jgi:hypothetical protein